VASFRGPWLNVLLRLQSWLCPDGLISQKHRTAALKQAASGKPETDWEGEHLPATSKGKYQSQIASQDEGEAETRLHPLLPKHISQAARVNAAVPQLLHNTAQSSSGKAEVPELHRIRRQTAEQGEKPEGSPQGKQHTYKESTASLAAGNSGICSVGAKLLTAAILLYLLRNSKSNERPNIAAFKRPQRINRATAWEMQLTTL